MALENYDYKKIEIKLNHFHVSYTHRKGEHVGCRVSKNKKIVKSLKIIDILSSLMSSILSIIKTIFT